jgi:hypothetical protein
MHQGDYERLKETSGGGAITALLVPAERAFAAIGVGRTKGYELIRNGHLVARKIGAKTLVEVESMRRFAASLPRAGGPR